MSKLGKLTLVSVALAILAVGFAAGFQFGVRAPASLAQELPLVGEAWSILKNDYVDRTKLDPTTLSRAGIEGIIKGLDDPYTAYLDPESYRLSSTGFEGQFEGIGATVATKDDQPIIMAPIPGSPADKAGIKAGDIILAVNGESTKGQTLTEVVLSIRGPTGTSVRLTIQHEGDATPIDVDIVRQKIEVATVIFEMRGDIAYINLSQFTGRTDQELTPALQQLSQKQAKGIIIDLRTNPGGLLDIVIDVASHFLNGGLVAKVVNNEGQETDHPVADTDVKSDLPMVVLVSRFSASGSEVLSGALQDRKRATIAGEKTFGKGSVNILRQLSDGSGIYVTTARWLTPDGRLIEGKGIEPDVTIPVEGDGPIQWAIDYLHGKK